MSANKPRTSKPLSEYRERLGRFAKHADEYIRNGTLPACPSCDGDTADGWMGEGGVPYLLACVDCGTVYNEDGEEVRQ